MKKYGFKGNFIKPKIKKYSTNQVKITRAGLSTNPVERFNFVSGTVFSPSSATNLVTNGDFASGSTGWVASGATIISSLNNELITIATAQFGRAYFTYNFVNGHKYYCSGYVKSDTNLVYLAVDGITTKYCNGLNSYERISLIHTEGIGAIRGLSFRDFRTSGYTAISQKNIAMIDLTILFGAGNEPTQAWCDVNLPFFNGTQDILSPNALVKHGENFFIGGDTATHEFDFSTKVANSVVECPMRILTCSPDLANLPVPSSGSWVEALPQADIDKIKVQEGTVYNTFTLTNGLGRAMLAELDLTPLCNALFGGSNSALKSALKAINVDVWAMGSGVGGTGINGSFWIDNTSWINYTSGSESIITKKSMTVSSSANRFVNTSNKLYILIASQFSTDGVTQSSVSLDYLNIKIDIARTPDTVQPISVNLPKYWAMVVKGFSPAWDFTQASNKRIAILYAQDGSRYVLTYTAALKKISLDKYVQNTWKQLTEVTLSSTFPKHQAINIIFGQNASGMFIKALPNGGTLLSSSALESTTLTGLYSFYLLMSNDNTLHANAFAESFTLLDLQRMGKIQYGQELVTNGDFATNTGAGWSIGSGVWGFSTGKATSDGVTSGYIYQTISGVLPNTKYVFSTESTGNKIVNMDFFNDGVYISSPVINASGVTVVTTPSTCTRIRAYLNVNTPGGGTLSYDNISLKQVLQDGLSDGEALSILKGQMHIKENNLVVNGDFSNGTTGWAGDSISVTNNTIANVANGVTAYSSIVSTTSLGSCISGKKVYAKAKIRVRNSVCAHIDITITTPANKTVAILNTPIQDQWYTMSGIYSMTENTGVYNIKFLESYADTATANGKVMEVQDVSCIDLTTLFGAGLEPTLAQCDAMFAQGSTNPIALTNPELFDINKVTLHANATRNNGVITLNATANSQNSQLDISVLPNNRYALTVGTNNATITVYELYNNIVIKTDSVRFDTEIGSKTFTTLSNTNKVRVIFSNSVKGAGTFTFSQISLRRKD